jgi:uncharacterized protein YbcC (UPF0753/DUF2309 family)
LPVLHLTHSDELQVLQPMAIPGAATAGRQPQQGCWNRRVSAHGTAQGQDGIPPTSTASPAVLLRQKGHHWAETRPEWGLANTASLPHRAAAPPLDLHGRAFLQEYDWRQDPQASQLAGIFGGPLVVAHWINMQYFAAVADPARYGSGNKLLHNVVGGALACSRAIAVTCASACPAIGA